MREPNNKKTVMNVCGKIVPGGGTASIETPRENKPGGLEAQQGGQGTGSGESDRTVWGGEVERLARDTPCGPLRSR